MDTASLPESYTHDKYFLVVVDDYTRFGLSFHMKQKSSVPEILESLITHLRTFNIHVSYLRSDNEFKNSKIHKLSSSVGIRQQLTTIYTPQQEGVSERNIQTLITKARTLLIDSQPPNDLWPEAI